MTETHRQIENYAKYAGNARKIACTRGRTANNKEFMRMDIKSVSENKLSSVMTFIYLVLFILIYT